MEKQNKLNIFKICVGVYFIASVFYAYYGDYHFLYELTAVSNLLNGVILIVNGILGFRKKSLNIIVNLMALECILCVYTTVFIVAFQIANFNFAGGFMLLHGVNPLIALCFFLFAERCEFQGKKELLLRILIAPLMFMAYLLFDLIFYFCNGRFVYQLLPSNLPYLAPIVAIILYGLLAAMGYGLLKLKSFVQSKF